MSIAPFCGRDVRKKSECTGTEDRPVSLAGFGSAFRLKFAGLEGVALINKAEGVLFNKLFALVRPDAPVPSIITGPFAPVAEARLFTTLTLDAVASIRTPTKDSLVVLPP